MGTRSLMAYPGVILVQIIVLISGINTLGGYHSYRLWLRTQDTARIYHIVKKIQ